MNEDWEESNGTAGLDENGLEDISDAVGGKVGGYAKDAAKRAAKEVARMAAKAAAEAAKKVGQAIAEVAKQLGALIVETLPWSAIVIAVLVLLIFVFSYTSEFFNPLEAIRYAYTSTTQWFQEKAEDVMGGLKNFWNGITDGGDYEDEINDYNGSSNEPEDFDHTAIAIQETESWFGEGDVETSSNPDEIGTVDETYISRLMNKEMSYYTQENLIYLLQTCTDYNNQMFRYFKQYYDYKQWELKPYFRNGVQVGVKWQKAYRTLNTTDDISSYPMGQSGNNGFEKLSRIHIEGELDDKNERRFAVHWQDVMTAAYMLSINKDSSEVDPEGITYKEDQITQVEEIDPEEFLKEGEIKQCFDLFRYNFDYYYGDTEELSKHDSSGSRFKYKTTTGSCLREGGYQLGYRYKRIADPVTSDDGADYSSSSDYTGDLPYTIFTPEQAPNVICNSWEALKYVYISTDDIPDYTPDPDVYEPPKGVYCIGRWDVINPKPFIEGLDAICPYYRNMYKIHGEGWDWVQLLIDEFNEFEEVLPWTDEATRGVGNSRAQFFQQLADMYKAKTIKVSYEGTAYEDMDEFISDLEEQYPGWHIIWDEDYQAELRSGIRDNLRRNSETGEIGIGSSETTGGGEELSDEEVENVASDVMDLAKIIYLEAGGQSYEGKVAVGTVIMNRVGSSAFPNTISEVIRDPRQFSPVGSGKFDRTSDAAVPTECINIAYNIIYTGLTMDGWPDDVIGFQNPVASNDDTPELHGSWPHYATIQDHWFYTQNDYGSGHSGETSNDGDSYEDIVSADARSGGTGEGARSNITGEFYPPFADPKTYPFWSYATTFHSLSGYGDNLLQISDDDGSPTGLWALDYDDTRDNDLSHMYDPIEGEPDEALEEMVNYYINQGKYSDREADKRGTYNSTISKSGCSDCTLAMIVSYWKGEQVDVHVISDYVDSSGALQWQSALDNYDLTISDAKAQGNTDAFIEGVKSELDAGHPPVVHIKSYWKNYHTTSNGHFLTIYGYDSGGFYVLDPGKKSNHYIPREDWYSVDGLYYRSVTHK